MQRVLMLFVALVVIAAPLVLVGCNTVPADRFRELQDQRARLVAEKEALEARIKELRDTMAKLQNDIAAMEDARIECERLSRELAAKQKELAELNRKLADTASENQRLQAELQNAGINAKLLGGGVAVPLSGDILFDSGKTDLKKEGKLALQNLQEGINKVLKAGNFQIEFIRIDGHTDTDPIRHASFEDNWTLGAGRANSVRKYLEELGGWKQYKLSIASYAYTVPVDPATTTEAKARNRRVEIYLVPNPKNSN